jgi:hypothetical protein
MALFKRQDDSKRTVPTDSRDAALSQMQRAFPEDPKADVGAQMRSRIWMRNQLYYMGEQWLVYVRGSGKFGRMYGDDMSIPTPVSDFISDTVNSLCALTLNKRFVTRIWPNSEELQDRSAAELGGLLLRHLDAKGDFECEDIKEMIELTRVITGNGFARVYPETGEHYVFDADGNALDKGDITVEPVLPFNVSVPDAGTLLRQKAWWACQTLKSREWVEDIYQVNLPKGSARDRGNISLQKQLLKMVSEVSSWKGADLDLAELDKPEDELVMLREMELKPTKSKPHGQSIVTCEGKVLVDTDELVIPEDTAASGRGERAWDYSLVHFPYRRQIGSFWSKDGVSALISPQNITNEIDQSLAINRQTFGRPWVLTPAGLTLRRLSNRSSKILAMEFDPGTAQGVPPQVFQGVPYPSQVLDERQQQRQVAQDVSGDPKNVLQGESPSGASGVMVDILRETAEQSHVPDIMRFYRGWNRVNKLRLRLAQKVYTESRTLKAKGAGNRIQVRQFRGADLRNNTDVRFELDSGAASTNAGRNAFLTRLLEIGFWGDISQQPGLRSELLRRFGLSGFAEAEDKHRKRAETENAILVEGDRDLLRGVSLPPPEILDDDGQPVMDDSGEPETYPWPHTFDPVFEHDPHDAHLMIHDEFMFSPEFRDLEADAKSRVVAHRDMHYAVLQFEMEQEIEAQLLMSGQGGAQSQPGGGPAPGAPGQTPSPAAPGAAPGGPPPPPGGSPTPNPAGQGAAPPGNMSPTGGGAAGGAGGMP